MTIERILIIAEAGVNHDGSLEKAVALVDAAADATLAPIGLTIDAKRIWLTRQLVLLPEVS